MKTQMLLVRVTTDHDLSDSKLQLELARLFKGYSSEIQHAELLELEVVNVLGKGKVS